MGTHLIELQNPRYLLGITDEPKQLLQPILCYALEPLISLEDACEPILDIVPHLPTYIWIAKKNSKNPSDGLTQDESAAIHLYTTEWDPTAHTARGSLYSHLNRTLKESDRTKLRPWFRYLKLFLTALAKFPAIPRQTVWRDIRKDLSSEYLKDSKATWWGFSSCTTSLNVLESDLYLGNTGTRTLFLIETFNARSIRAHSHFKVEDEILLLPGTYFEVISQLRSSSDLNIIHLRQIRPPYQLLEPPFEGAELLPNLGSDPDMRKPSGSLLTEETIILGAVLGTHLGKNTSLKNVEPQVNLDPKLLVGWTLCYEGQYDRQLYGPELDRMLNECNKANLLMACRFIDDSNFTVVAMGKRSDVTYHASILDISHVANGVRWYFATDSGWGFAKGSDNVQRTGCDDIFDQNGDQRLCWHTRIGLNGFRCGKACFNLSGYYYPNQWFRILYHAD